MTSQRKQHIAFYLQNLNGGGAERAIINWANALSGRGHHVDLVVAENRGVYFDEVSISGELVILDSRNPGAPRRNMLLNLFTRLKTILKLRCWLSQNKPLIVFGALGDANINLWLAHKISSFKPKLVLSQRSNYSESLSEMKNIHGTFWRLFLPQAFRDADFVVAVSMGVAEDLQQKCGLNPPKLVTLPNIVEQKKLRELAAKRMEKEELVLEGSYIVCVGRLVPKKRIKDVIKAFKAISDEIPDHKLVVLGEGPMKLELSKLTANLDLEDRVLMAGFENNPYTYISKSKLLVLASELEGFPGVLLEAMALNVPVVATDCPSGPREILDDGTLGPLVEVGDIEGLAKGMLQELRRTEKVNFDAKIQQYSLEKLVDEFEKKLIFN